MDEINGRRRTGTEGFWAALSRIERSSRYKLSSKLAPFERPIRNCYECGVQVVTLPPERTHDLASRAAALFLKRILNDLRTVWLLVCTGYTSQAASVAAALSEHALAVSCLAGSPANARRLVSEKTGDLPWSPVQLCKMHARELALEKKEQGKPFDEHYYEKTWREVYFAYKLLCKIKHPTLRSAVHDSFSTYAKQGAYVVMAAPDTSGEDLPLKAIVLLISLARCYSAIRSFFMSLECDENHAQYADYCERAATIIPDALEAYDSLEGTLPFSIDDIALERKWLASIEDA